MRKSPSSNPIDRFGDARPLRHAGRTKTSPPRNPGGPPIPPPFNRAGTLRWLAHIKSDAWWQSQMPIPMARLDAVLGLADGWISHMLAIHPKFPMTNAVPRISQIIPAIERRRLAFPEGKNLSPKFLWIDPPFDPPLINRLALASAWSLWATCQFCGDNQFLPVVIDGKPHVACYTCIKPDQYRAIGAVAVKKSLIHEALKKFY